jgi:hypothetical protein
MEAQEALCHEYMNLGSPNSENDSPPKVEASGSHSTEEVSAGCHPDDDDLA